MNEESKMFFSKKAEDGSIILPGVTLAQLKKIFSDRSFPRIITSEFLDSLGYVEVRYSPAPEVDYTKNVVESAPVMDSNGKWYVNYEIVNASQEEISYRTEIKSNEVRSLRNSMLAECDWTQSKDVSDDVSNKWVSYRQSLRDITSQPEFPWNVVWPNLP